MPSLRALLCSTWFFLAVGCGLVNPPCSSSTCAAGCCDAAGECQPGGEQSACGVGASACAVCPTNFRCSLGACFSTTGAGGGGGSSGVGGGGGGAQGGGLGGGGGANGTSTLSFAWAFEGMSCAQAQISWVNVTLEGVTLPNAGRVPCSSGGLDGAVLRDLAPGSYAWSVAATASGDAPYFATGTVQVQATGSVEVNVRRADSTVSLGVSWTFPASGASASPTCTQAGISSILAIIDETQTLSMACAEGFAPSQTSITLSRGLHTLSFYALAANSVPTHRKTFTFDAQPTGPTSRAFVFDWAVGGLALRWTFSNGANTLNCAQAGISQVSVTLRRSEGDIIFDEPCMSGTVQGVLLDQLPPGSFELLLRASGSAGAAYSSNPTTLPTVTVVEGQFPQLSSATPAYLLTH